MCSRGRLLVFLAVALSWGVTRVDAQPVHIEVRSAAGPRLGQLTGTLDGKVAYFELADLARLVQARVRKAGGGDRVVLVLRDRTLAMWRDSPRVVSNGRALTLSAPVRRPQGVWLVPGELLVKALPGLLGGGVHVALASPPPPRPVVRPVSLPSPPSRLPPALARSAAREAPAAPAPAVQSSSPRPGTNSPGGVAPEDPAAAEAASPGVLKAGPMELRYRSYPTFTRVVLEGATTFEPRLVESRGDLVVPLAGLRGRAPRTVQAVRDGLIESLELTESRGQAALRVTFEHAPESRKVYRLKDPPRLVLDFHRATSKPAAAETPGALRTIVVDPGHGGHDPGGVGPNGLQEKDVTLDIARRLGLLSQEELGVKVVFTRTRDQFVPLRERTAFANRQKADLFVSIHINAAAGASAAGAEAYFLSSEATDNAARAAAAFENKVIALEPGPRNGSRDLLRSILWDLTQSEFQQESSRLAEALQDSLERALKLTSRGVKQAPFYVLGGAAMPAVLVEVGFISNPQEEQRLANEGYRDRIARALAAGLAAYKRHYDQKNGVVAAR